MSNFSDFGLDPRLLAAISKLSYEHPTLVQEKSIPIGLEGRDLLIQARTGSGKTVAFAVPLVQRLLLSANTEPKITVFGPQSIILVPTRELCDQISQVLRSLTRYCADVVSICALVGDDDDIHNRLLRDCPSILICTPAKLNHHISTSTINLQSLAFLIIDEADLILSYGYACDIQSVWPCFPPNLQATLTSATLTADVTKLKRVILNRPAIVKLDEDTAISPLISLFDVIVPRRDKFLILYVIIRLSITKGRGIVYCKSLETVYRLKLLLEQFSIPSLMLNHKLPIDARLAVLASFNSNQARNQVLLAADDGGANEKLVSSESSTVRGLDYSSLDYIIFYDAPSSLDDWVHASGRIARGVCEAEHEYKVICLIGSDNAKDMKFQSRLAGDYHCTSLNLNVHELDGFRYRVEEVERKVTRHAIENEMITDYSAGQLDEDNVVDDNDNDDTTTKKKKKKVQTSIPVDKSLAYIPDYMAPKSLIKNKNVLDWGPSRVDANDDGLKNKKKKRKLHFTDSIRRLKKK